MPENLNVKRLAVSPRAIQEIPWESFPQIPASIRAKDPRWQQYQDELNLFWKNVRAIARSQSVAIKEGTE